MIELKSVTKSFAAAAVLDGIDLRIGPERTTVLIGPSGCGKSTLLRMMLGLVAHVPRGLRLRRAA